jgi:hypothetical protein
MREGFVHAAARLARLDERLVEQLAAPATPRPGAPFEQAGLAPLLDELRRLRAAVEASPSFALPAAGGPSGVAELVHMLPSMVKLFEASAEGLRTLDRRLEEALAQTRTALGMLRSGPGNPDEAQAALDRLRTSRHGLAEMRRELDGLGQAFRDVALSSRSILEAQHDPDVRADSTLAAALDQLRRQVDRFNERVRAFVRRADEDLARSSHLLTGAINDLEQEPR